MKNELNADGNVLGRLGALALLVAAGVGLHRINCDSGMCPLSKIDSCCMGARSSLLKQAPPPSVAK